MRGGSGLLFVQPGLFRLGGICFLPLAGGAPYTEGGAHGVPPLGHVCGATAPQSSGGTAAGTCAPSLEVRQNGVYAQAAYNR